MMMITLYLMVLLRRIGAEDYEEAFDAICHNVRRPTKKEWSKPCFSALPVEKRKKKRTSIHLQYDLLRLAQSLYFSQDEYAVLRKRKVSDFWTEGREHYGMSGGLLKSRILGKRRYAKGECQGARNAWYYLGINKNGISTFSHFFRSEVGFQNVERASLWLDWRQQQNITTFLYMRDPQSRFISAMLEVVLKHTYLIAKLPIHYNFSPQQKGILSQQNVSARKTIDVNLQQSKSPFHFLALADLFLRAEPGCNPQTNTAWCKNHVHRPNTNAAQRKKMSSSHNPSRAWHHLAPQMWFLDYWFPSEAFLYSKPPNFLIDLINSSTFAKTQFSNMCGPNNKKRAPHLDNRNVKSSLLLLSAKTQLKQNPQLQQAICALYARDYLCLGYSLPTVCKPVQNIICRTLFIEEEQN
uniref:Uncharacterized protein n=1 Tax=Aureoumbra lagunensis TaxID=44058 RepID=A0A7S3JTP1_9STRA|mmetsp:Transcript_1852/g.2467  ORF Transcript_1852/g.2467 Transcript_1852/m.2467 type:complete len:410 (+) Transcript_1852:219-1448(+)